MCRRLQLLSIFVTLPGHSHRFRSDVCLLVSWQVVWSAWLSTLGHAPMVDPTDFFHSTGIDKVVEGVSQAASHAAASPFGAHATAAVSGAVQVWPVRTPWSCLICSFDDEQSPAHHTMLSSLQHAEGGCLAQTRVVHVLHAWVSSEEQALADHGILVHHMGVTQ